MIAPHELAPHVRYEQQALIRCETHSIGEGESVLVIRVHHALLAGRLNKQDLLVRWVADVNIPILSDAYVIRVQAFRNNRSLSALVVRHDLLFAVCAGVETSVR